MFSDQLHLSPLLATAAAAHLSHTVRPRRLPRSGAAAFDCHGKWQRAAIDAVGASDADVGKVAVGVQS